MAMGCLHSKTRSTEYVRHVSPQALQKDNVNRNAELCHDRKKLKLEIELTDKERELIKFTWWKFRGEPDCRLRIMTHYFSKNPTVKKKFQRKNEENAANGNLITAVVSWNIRRFSIRLVEFVDRVVRDLEAEDYNDIYEICEFQGAKHFRLQRMVEPGDMENLGLSIQETISQHFGQKFNRNHILAWRQLFFVICARFTLGMVDEEIQEIRKTLSHEFSLKFPKFPLEEFQ